MNDLEKKEKRLAIARIIISVSVIIIMIIGTIAFLPMISKISNEETRIDFKNDVANMGLKGVFVVLILQILQIVVAVVPGQPMEIISGMLYGTWGGMLLCLVGILIGTTIVFYVVRKIGVSFIELFFSKEKIEELKNKKVFKNPAKFELLVFIIFVIPMIPKDIFIYVAGLTPVRPKRFIFLATLSRIPSLFITVFAGNSLSQGSFTTAVILVAAFLILGIIGYYISSKAQEKIERKAQEESIENINKKAV